MSLFTIYCIVCYIGMIFVLIGDELHYNINKLKGNKVEERPSSYGEVTAAFFFSPILFPIAIGDLIHKGFKIVIYNVAKLIVNFDISKIKNIF